MGCCTSTRANKLGIDDQLSKTNSKVVDKSDILVIEPSNFVFHKTSPIKNEYTFGPELGSGSFGSVRRAVHKQTGQERAIKTIKKSHITADKSKKSKFFSEVDILRSTDHPNIVRLFEFYEDQHYYHLVTELVKGGELFDFIVSSKQLSEPIAAYFFKQILSAVHYCHCRGIVHRDLKPENLLLDKKSSNALLKVIDFGTSILLEQSEDLSGKIGTAYYIAPEVINGRYNEKCDVWSCGVILYILLSGKPPFNGVTDQEIIERVINGKYSFKFKEWDLVSSDAKILISRMLEVDVGKRISALEALNDTWINNNLSRPRQAVLNSAILSNMQGFRSKGKLQQAVLSFISSQLANRDEIQRLSELFHAIDTNGDGKLSREELLAEYLKVMPLDQAEEDVETIMREVDINNSGFIDYSEFLMASLKRETLLSKENLESAFKVFDIDGSGSITSGDLRRLLGNEAMLEESIWKELINKADQNSDGIIDLREFSEMMLNMF